MPLDIFVNTDHAYASIAVRERRGVAKLDLEMDYHQLARVNLRHEHPKAES